MYKDIQNYVILINGEKGNKSLRSDSKKLPNHQSNRVDIRKKQDAMSLFYDHSSYLPISRPVSARIQQYLPNA